MLSPSPPRSRSSNSSTASIGPYKFIGHLGEGKFAKVELAIHRPTHEKVAVKVLPRMGQDAVLAHEARALLQLSHPNIVYLFQVIETLEYIYLVMEHARFGTLAAAIERRGRYEEEEARPLFLQLASAVSHMHDVGIVHRDLKAENVLLAGPQLLKIADFGFSAFTSDLASLGLSCGSPTYAAPELFAETVCNGEKADVWALGVLLVLMLSGKLPFMADSLPALREALCRGVFTRPSVSASCGELIDGMLTLDMHARWCAAQVRDSAWLQRSGACSPSLSAHDHMDRQEAWYLLESKGAIDRRPSFDNARTDASAHYRIVLHSIQERRRQASLSHASSTSSPPPRSLSLSTDQSSPPSPPARLRAHAYAPPSRSPAARLAGPGGVKSQVCVVL